MLKGSLSHYSPFSQLLMCLMVIFGSFFLSMFVGSIFAYLIFDVNIFTNTEALDISGELVNIPLLKFYQAIYSTGMFIIPPFIVAFLLGNKTLGFLFLDRRTHFSSFVLAAFTIVASLPLINFLSDINSHLRLPEFLSGIETWMRNSEDQAEIITGKFLVMENPFDLLLNLLIIAVIPALGEELLFRGVIQKLFSKMTHSAHWGIVITAFLFAALHMQFFGLLPRMVMGMLFGYLLIWTKNLWVPIVAHLVNNGLAVIATYFISKGSLPKTIEEVGSGSDFWVSGSISLVLVLLLMAQLFRTRERQA